MITNYLNLPVYRRLAVLSTSYPSLLRVFSARCSSSLTVKNGSEKELSLPVYAKLRGTGRNVYSLVEWKNKEMLADYVLFEDSMAKCRVSWLNYKGMTSDERSVYLAHYMAVQNRKLEYKCPLSGVVHRTVAQLLYEGKCCGEGCRHCPYELENCTDAQKRSLIWNSAYYL